MSSAAEVAASALTRLLESQALSTDFSLCDATLCINGRPVLIVPKESMAGSWRTTINKSLLPASVSPESRRHLLYAVLQDFIRNDLLLHENTTTVYPLTDFDSRLAPFDNIYRMPAQRSSDRVVLFPIHIAVPAVFDTYARRPHERDQTDKGFRGKFIEFFSCDDTGYYDDHLTRVLRNLFAKTEGLTPLDLALVKSLGQRLCTSRRPHLQSLLGDALLQLAGSGDCSWWHNVYADSQTVPAFRPLDSLADHGLRLHADVDAIAHTYGLSRIERVACVERLLAYHFAIYMVRLTQVLYRELDWACRAVFHRAAYGAWSGRDLVIRYHERRPQVPRDFHSDYDVLASQLSEAYLLLPVINNLDLAIRSVAAYKNDLDPAIIADGKWADAKAELCGFREDDRVLLLQVLAFLAEVGATYTQLSDPLPPADVLVMQSVDRLYGAIRSHYSLPEQRRYPVNHHRNVFDSVAGSGPSSFLQAQPFKHFALGDELIYLIVLAMFEHRGSDERSDSTCVERAARQLRRQRLALRDFEDRLERDLLVPASDAARDDLRSSLARLGLLDRLSDIGEGNFLRHPTGI